MDGQQVMGTALALLGEMGLGDSTKKMTKRRCRVNARQPPRATKGGSLSSGLVSISEGILGGGARKEKNKNKIGN